MVFIKQRSKIKLAFTIGLLGIGLLQLASSVESSVLPTKENSSPQISLSDTSLAAIKSLIHTDCDSNQQCEVIGVVPAPCGGYKSHWVYSTKSTDAATLKSKVEALNSAIKLKNKKDGMMGICQFIEPPKALCRANNCLAERGNSL